MVEQPTGTIAPKYFQPIAAANPVRVFKLGTSEGILYDAIPSAGRTISYNFVLAVFSSDSKDPAFCIASENSPSIPKGVALLGFFDGKDHRPINVSPDWLDVSRFGIASMEMAAEILHTSADEIKEVHFENPSITMAVRTPWQIQSEYGISPEQFQVLYLSYETMFAAFPAYRNWNADIDLEERTKWVLRQEEIAVAVRRLSQAIKNRVILRLDYAREKGENLFPNIRMHDPPSKATNPWWKFW